jgi:hypothetical protein
MLPNVNDGKKKVIMDWFVISKEDCPITILSIILDFKSLFFKSRIPIK